MLGMKKGAVETPRVPRPIAGLLIFGRKQMNNINPEKRGREIYTRVSRSDLANRKTPGLYRVLFHYAIHKKTL